MEWAPRSLLELLVLALLSTASYYLGARARITRFAWSRYPRPVAELARCAACSGFWLGGAWWLLLGWGRGPIVLLGLLGGLLGLVLVPLVGALFCAALELLDTRSAP